MKYTYLNIKGAKALLWMAICSLACASCDNRRLGEIEGTITDAEGQLLVLEHLTDGAPRLVDTLRLDASGKFKFKPEVEEGPDFFSLRLNNQSISLVVDTLLTPVQISASANKLSAYSVAEADAQNQELHEAVTLGNRLRGQVLEVNKAVNAGSLNRQQSRDSVLTLVRAYKANVLEKYIFQNPSSPASYYLLFETISGLSVFDPNDASDVRAFGAVATGWQFNYPKSPRNKILEKVTVVGQANRRRAAAQAQRTDSLLSNTPIETRTFPELELLNADDRRVSLSSLVDGTSTVLVDFTAYYMDFSPAHNMALSNLCQKYAGKVKVYQVSMDFDENFWKVSADNLPWTTVRDQSCQYDQYGNVAYSAAALQYNVSKLPTTFVIDAQGELQSRIEQQDAQLESLVKKYIK